MHTHSTQGWSHITVPLRTILINVLQYWASNFVRNLILVLLHRSKSSTFISSFISISNVGVQSDFHLCEIGGVFATKPLLRWLFVYLYILCKVLYVLISIFISHWFFIYFFCCWSLIGLIGSVFMVVLWLHPPMAGAETQTMTLVALVLASCPDIFVQVVYLI